MGHKISKEQIDPGVKEHIMSFVGDVNELETDEKSNIIDAVNSLIVDRVDNAENMGKLANAIGEPITANHSVNEVVEGLGEMLSTFKTNMMNNGVVVESGDKFKQLIDKLTILSDSEGSGIQFSTGFINKTSLAGESNTNWVRNPMTFDTPLPFTPTRVIVSLPDVGMNTDIDGNYYIGNISVDSLLCFDDNVSDELSMYDVHGDRVYLYITNITNDGFDLYAKKTSSNNPLGTPRGIYWCAIGVGEEDTTLRDSLANILGDKGVDVTEEDDMASLISKVDSISGGLDIISATELPTAGRENQICVITDNPTNNFLISQNIDDINSNNNNNITIYTVTSGTKVPITTNNLVTNYYFGKVCQGGNRLASYIYQNGNWEQLTQKYVALIENGTYLNESYHGGITAGANLAKYVAGKGIQNKDTDSNSCYVTFNNKIDFSTYDSLKVTVYTSDSNAGSLFMFAGSGTINTNTTSTITVNYQSESKTITMTSTTFTFDISSWTGSHYLGAYLMGGYLSRGYITDIILC